MGLELAQMLETAGSYPQFLSHLAQFMPGISRTYAGQIYRAARYFSDPERILRGLVLDQPIPRELARVTGTTTEHFGTFAQYRYNVGVNVVFPRHQDSRIWYVYVEANELLTPQQAAQLAINFIGSTFKEGSDLLGASTDTPYVESTWVTDFTRFEKVN